MTDQLMSHPALCKQEHELVTIHRLALAPTRHQLNGASCVVLPLPAPVRGGWGGGLSPRQYRTEGTIIP